MTYTVHEIYYTLQGEGAQTGRPAVFLRFAGCNLWSGREQHRAAAVCRFCDTEFVGKTGPGGCFVLNSVVECAHRSAPLEALARDFDARRRAAFVKRFRAAQKRGELPAEADAKSLGEFFSGQTLALAVMGRAGASRKALDRFIDVAMSLLPAEET